MTYEPLLRVQAAHHMRTPHSPSAPPPPASPPTCDHLHVSGCNFFSWKHNGECTLKHGRWGDKPDKGGLKRVTKPEDDEDDGALYDVMSGARVCAEYPGALYVRGSGTVHDVSSEGTTCLNDFPIETGEAGCFVDTSGGAGGAERLSERLLLKSNMSLAFLASSLLSTVLFAVSMGAVNKSLNPKPDEENDDDATKHLHLRSDPRKKMIRSEPSGKKMKLVTNEEPATDVVDAWWWWASWWMAINIVVAIVGFALALQAIADLMQIKFVPYCKERRTCLVVPRHPFPSTSMRCHPGRSARVMR